MLYDPKWEQLTKADPLSLDSLIAWLERQPAGAIYCYTSSGGCLLAQYFAAHGFHRPSVSARAVNHGPRLLDHFKLPPNFNDISIDHPRTFGAALARARALHQQAVAAGGTKP